MIKELPPSTPTKIDRKIPVSACSTTKTKNYISWDKK